MKNFFEKAPNNFVRTIEKTLDFISFNPFISIFLLIVKYLLLKKLFSYYEYTSYFLLISIFLIIFHKIIILPFQILLYRFGYLKDKEIDNKNLKSKVTQLTYI
jgi:hypothetical protein